jgi:tyramine---L-glutamate ligase
MRIFLFEFTTGGGLIAEAHSLKSLASEGRAMVTALATDFAALANTQIVLLCDHRYPLPPLPNVRVREVINEDDYRVAFDQEAAEADWTIVIAPECDGMLLDRCQRVAQCGGLLLGPSPEIIRLAGDKHAMAEHLRGADVPAPQGELTTDQGDIPSGLRFPLVLKPRDGAGSLSMRRLDAPFATNQIPGDFLRERAHWRVEEFCPGLPASVAVFCGPAGCVPLAPCRQLLSDDGQFHYLGGRLPLTPLLAERATRLARRAIITLSKPLGYLGVDLVLGHDPTGSEDTVIEINPRPTTSYVGLRVATRSNLAAALLAVAAGEIPTLLFADEPLEFTSEGTVKK